MREKRALEALVEALSVTQAAPAGRNDILAEALQHVNAMLSKEDKGWDLLKGARELDDGGLSLDDLKMWSLKLREDTVGAPWIKRGFSLRSSYIWQGGIKYKGIPGKSAGRAVNVQDKIDDPRNQRAFFSKQARRRREGMLYHDGIAVWIMDDNTKLLEVVPLAEITGKLTDPDHNDIIYAYRRAWTHRNPDGSSEGMVRWYFVDTYKDLATKTITVATDGKVGDPEIVDQSKTAFDMHANSVEGWAFGAPDALAAWYWNGVARDLYMDGVDVSEGLASIIFKMTGATAKGGQSAGVQYASPQMAGGMAVVGGGGDMTTMSSAGHGYNFSSIREVIALIASALDVSNIHLTSNPGDAGSSYGSAQSLDLPTRLAMQARRDEHIDLDMRVLRWMAGKEAGKKIKVYFEALDDAAEIYRKVQAIILKWQNGLMQPQDASDAIDEVFGIPAGSKVPPGIIIPSNTKFPQSTTNDASADGGAGGSGSQAASPTQGRSNGTGDSKSAPRDTRDDTVS